MDWTKEVESAALEIPIGNADDLVKLVCETVKFNKRRKRPRTFRVIEKELELAEWKDWTMTMDFYDDIDFVGSSLSIKIEYADDWDIDKLFKDFKFSFVGHSSMKICYRKDDDFYIKIMDGPGGEFTDQQLKDALTLKSLLISQGRLSTGTKIRIMGPH